MIATMPFFREEDKHMKCILCDNEGDQIAAWVPNEDERIEHERAFVTSVCNKHIEEDSKRDGEILLDAIGNYLKPFRDQMGQTPELALLRTGGRDGIIINGVNIKLASNDSGNPVMPPDFEQETKEEYKQKIKYI